MSDVFREVDEDLRRERLREFWNRYGLVLLLGAVLLVLAVAVFVWLDSRAQRQAALEGDRYYAALELLRNGDTARADDAFAAIVADGKGGYPVLASLNAATAKAVAGDTSGAVAAYDAIAADAAVDDAIRDVARIRAGMLLADTASLDEMRNRLGPMSEADGAFRPLALELLAVTAIRVGEYDTAIGWLATLAADANTTQEAQMRASRLFSLILSRRGLTGAAQPVEGPAVDGPPTVDLRTGADTAPAFGAEDIPGVGAPTLRIAPEGGATLTPVAPEGGVPPALTPGPGLAPGATF